jgi:phosphohistidine phosphatase
MPALYLIRHGIAAERGDDWPDDAKRPLTHKGLARMREVAAGLHAMGADVDVVLSSPLVRARETAGLVSEAQKPSPPVVLIPALAPGGTPAEVAEELGRHAAWAALALVGHEPGLGELAAWLIGARAALALKKGGACRIDVASLPPAPARSGQLVWLATPKMLRAMARL